MQITLRPGLFGAVWCRDLIFFDARGGDYHLVAGAAEFGGVSGAGSHLDVEQTEFAVFLETEGLAVDRGRGGGEERPLPPAPTASALDMGLPSNRACRWKVIRAYLETIVLYPGRPLPALLRFARPAAMGGKAEASDLAIAFHHLSPWLPFQGVCLFRSFMLMRLLSRAGVKDASWVFGVRAWPFHAHCWVQQGHLALTDHAEALVSYSPIFAI